MATPGTPPVNAQRLFVGSCVALISTSTIFAVIAAVMGPIKVEFILSNQQVGRIAFAATAGFTIPMVLAGPFVDNIGMKNLMRLAFVSHVAGLLLMIFASSYLMLFFGALTLAIGNGLVEAACNPLVASLYPNNKTVKLNQFHVWFPGGIVLGTIAVWLLSQFGLGGAWQVTLSVVLIPTVVYFFLFLGQEFPETERVTSGHSTKEMWRAAIVNPFMILMLICMAMTASLELAPGRWIPSVMTAGGVPGILVLGWGSLLMAVLRYFAGPVVHRLMPTGILFGSAILGGVGLLLLSYAQGAVLVFAAATIFYVGVCYFWPTMLGVVAERNVVGGALALALMGGMGMFASGLATELMGGVADSYVDERLPTEQTVTVLQNAVSAFDASGDVDYAAAADAARDALAVYSETGALPGVTTANALRAVIDTGAELPVVASASALLGPADNYGGRIAFRWVTPFAVFLAVVFGVMYVRDRRRGGPYAPESTVQQAQREAMVSA